MHQNNFCAECGERLARRGWRGLMRGRLCADCARRRGWLAKARPLVMLAITAVSSFALGRYLRPAVPPLVIERAANSPLADRPVNLNDSGRATTRKAPDPNQNAAALTIPAADEAVYICGARTKKGTPCHRRVHVAGERCFQHKGLPSLLPLSKLVVRP